MDSAVKLFEETVMKCSEIITKKYSTSFTLGIKLLDKKYHSPIYAVYAFVRYADEIVDTFLDKDRATLIKNFKQETFQAIEHQLSLNPVLHSFQLVVNKYKIDHELINAFYLSMEMDLQFKEYSEDQYKSYVYGSAEVVGLMCLKIFCEGDDLLYNKLREPARRLGSAFQKVNFLRDIKSDYKDRGRVYFPSVDFNNFDAVTKKVIEADIQQDFNEALPGIDALPEGAASGVRMAYRCYQELFNKIKTFPSDVLIEKRVRLTNWQKLTVLASEKFLYLALNIFIISCTLPLSFESRVRFYSRWYALFPAIIVTAVFFIYWDVLFTRRNVWKFNSRHILGVYIMDLPIEEWLFFFTVPYSCVFIYDSLQMFFSEDCFQQLGVVFLKSAIPLLLGGTLFVSGNLFTCIDFLVAAGVLSIHYFVFGERLLGKFFIALVVHYIPFYICNSVLTGGINKSEPVVFYNSKNMLNIRIGTIPFEDAVYSMSLFLMNVSIYEYIQDLFS